MTATPAPTPVQVATEAAKASGMTSEWAAEFAGHFIEKARALGLTVSTHLPAPTKVVDGVPEWDREDLPVVTAEAGRVCVYDRRPYLARNQSPEQAELFGHHLRAAAPYARRQAEEIEQEAQRGSRGDRR